jgi:hypothetical protein
MLAGADETVNRSSKRLKEAELLKKQGCPIMPDLLKSYEADLIAATERKAELQQELLEVENEISGNGSNGESRDGADQATSGSDRIGAQLDRSGEATGGS